MRFLLGDTAPSIPPSGGSTSSSDPTSNIDSLSKTIRKPTNAQALAALEAQWEATDKEGAMSAGIAEGVAEAYFMTLGILPRMRLLACGWTNPGDRFKSPEDAAWWKREYAFPLWEPLRTYSRWMKQSNTQTPWRWNDALASGDPGELSQAILAVNSELVVLTQKGHDVCAPYIIPSGRDTFPSPNPVCIAKLKSKEQKKERDDEKKEKKRDKEREETFTKGKVLLVAFGLYAVTFHWKHGRWPWT